MGIIADWRVWLPVVGWVVAAVVLSQALLHNLFMDLNMFVYHVVAGLIQAVLLLVPAALYVLWRDSARRERESREELGQTERMRDDLVAMLVHDLKTPVVTAAMALDLLLEEAGERKCLPADEWEMVRNARRNLGRLEGMVGDILAVSVARQGRINLRVAPSDPCELVAEQVEGLRLQAVARGIELTMARDCDVPALQLDRTQIRRVLDNLLTNAITYTPAGGRVAVSVHRQDGEVVVSVADTGGGMDGLGPELFEPYTQGSSRRSGDRASVGLGLAFCKLAVEAHGGRIWAESTGEGSRFSFALPAPPSVGSPVFPAAHQVNP